MKNDSLGNRIKRYEFCSRQLLTRRIPVIIRCDGKAFHTYTRGFNRPFDDRIISTMVEAALLVSKEIQGFKIGYVQSDEASFLLTDYDNLETESWFDYNVQKMCSITASVMTAHFNRIMDQKWNDQWENYPYSTPYIEAIKLKNKIAYFDARAFNIPREDVPNYFKWRQQDWLRNSLSMYCSNFFSPKEMHGKKASDQHEMLHSIGKNWATDLSLQEKNGTFIYKKENEMVLDNDYIVEYNSLYEKTKGI